MLRIARIFENIFLDEDVSFLELLNCATDTLQRLIANNPGAIYNGIINGLGTALFTVGQCATDDLVKLGLRKAAKESKNIFRASLPEHISTIYSKLAGKLGSKSPLLNSLFPNGREIFGSCQDDDLTHHLQTLNTNITPLLPQLGAIGPEAQSDVGGLLSTWITLHAASEASTGAKTASEKEKRDAKENLAAKLHVALLTIALQTASQASALKKAVTKEEAADTASQYFRQDLLEDHPPAPPEEGENPAPNP